MCAPFPMSSLLLHLRPENALIQDQILSILGSPVEERSPTLDSRLGDFDGSYWRVEVVEGMPNHVFVCLECPCFALLQR